MAETNDGNVLNFRNNGKKEKKQGFLHTKKGVITVLCLFVLVMAIALTIAAVVLKNKRKNEVNNNPYVSKVQYVTPFSYAKIGLLGNTVIVLTEDEITGLTEEGVWKWSYEGPFNNPSCEKFGRYMAVTEEGKDSILLFSEDGFAKRLSAEGKIVNFSGQKQYAVVTYVAENGEYGVALYDSEKDKPAVFARKYVSAYMISGAMSEKGSFICASGIEKDSGSASSVLSFIRVTDGEVYASEITEDGVLPVICTAGDTVFAANTEKLLLVKRMPSATIQSDKKIVLWERNGASESLVAMAASNSTAAVVRDNINSMSSDSLISFYGTDASLISEMRSGMKLKGIKSFENVFAAYSENKIILLDSRGKVRGTFETAGEIKDIRFKSSSVLYLLTDSEIITADFARKGQ